MLAFRPIALVLALLALSSCAYGPDNSVFTGGRCVTNSAKYLQGVDWHEATKLNLRIRQDDFLPVYLGLLQNRAYVLAIENADDTNHSFRAMEFFRAVAVAGVRADGGEFEQAPCLKGVSIPAGKVTEIRLVAIRDGSYEFDDNALMFSLAMVGSAGGFITIEPPRVLLESPLDHLKLFVSKPVVAEPQESKPAGLFDDQQETPAPAPGGLFDDQEQPPSQPSGGLFDDPAPEQPINGSPSVPVETVPEPSENLFGEPSLAPPAEQPEAPLVDAPAQADPAENLFNEPSLQPQPEQPEAPLVDAPAQADPAESLFNEPSLAPPVEQPEAPLVEAPLEAPVVEAPLEAPVVEAPPETSPAPAASAPLDSETDMMMEEAPIVEGAPEIPEKKAADDAEEMFVEEAPQAPVAPVSMPDDYEHLEGPPADIFSDPPDVVNSGSGSGGAAGDDQLGGSG